MKKSVLFSAFALISLVGIISCGDSNKKLDLASTYNLKKTYFVGDTINYDDLKVVDNKTREVITDYKISPAPGTILNDPKEGLEIKISKNGYKTLTYKVDVYAENDAFSGIIDIFSLNDFHGAFTNDKDKNQTGLSRIAGFLENQREINPYTFVVSAGDMWQGGVESNKTKGIIMTDAMNRMDFAAMAIGNHEFDWGEEAIIANKSIMEFPLLNANIFYKENDTRPEFLTPSMEIKVAGTKIGLVGAGSTTLGSDIVASVSNKFVFKDPIPYVKEESEKLRNNGCEFVILVAHDPGFYESENLAGFVYKDLISDGNKYIDGAFLGHDHYKKSGMFNGVPYVEGGSNGKYLSQISFHFLKSKKDFIHTQTTYNILNTQDETSFNNPIKEIDDLIEKYKDEIGDINRVIYNFSGYVSKSDFLQIACKSIIQYINDNKKLYEVEVMAGVHNGGGIRTDFAGGKFKYKDLIQVSPFSNTLTIVKLTPEQYSSFVTYSGHAFYEAKPLDPSKEFIYVGTINYVSESLNVGELVIDTGIYIQEAIEYHLKKNTGIY